MAQPAKDDPFTKAIPICAVVSDPTNYEGREILVTGLYRFAVHGSLLIGEACSQIEVNLTTASVHKDNKEATSAMRRLVRKDEFRPVEVVMRGTFRTGHEGQCFGQFCAPYQFEDSELVAARPQSKK
jgi:hypothetical protein